MFSDQLWNYININSCWPRVFKVIPNLFEVFYVQRLDFCEVIIPDIYIYICMYIYIYIQCLNLRAILFWSKHCQFILIGLIKLPTGIIHLEIQAKFIPFVCSDEEISGICFKCMCKVLVHAFISQNACNQNHSGWCLTQDIISQQ